jgi:hypothetical protein
MEPTAADPDRAPIDEAQWRDHLAFLDILELLRDRLNHMTCNAGRSGGLKLCRG